MVILRYYKKNKFSSGRVKLYLKPNSQLLNKFRKVFTSGSPCVSWSEGSMVLFSHHYINIREEFYWTKILGEYIYIYIYIWGTNGIVGIVLSEWVCRLIMGNVKTKSLMGKKSCLWQIGENLWAWNMQTKGKKCLKLSGYGHEWFICRLVGANYKLKFDRIIEVF